MILIIKPFGTFQTFICAHMLFNSLVMVDLEKRLPKGAPVTMRRKGKRTDAIVMQLILEKPRSTVHEIAEDLGWTNGRVDGSINRLLRKGKVRVQHCIRRGMLVKKLHPMEEEIRTPNTIEIPKEMIAEDIWKDRVHVYSLSRSSIAISATKNEEWEKRAFWKGDISVEEHEKKLIVRLPDHLSDFYRLDNSETSLSTRDEFALVTVESTIVPVELPPTFPAFPVYRRTRDVLMVDELERVASWPTEPIPGFYGEYIEDEERTVHMIWLTEYDAHMLSLRAPKKKRVASGTSHPVETAIEAVVRQ